MNSLRPLFFAALLSLLALVTVPARAQSSTTTTTSGSSPVLVYKISFTDMGDSINFRSYQGGYLVFDVGYTGSNTGTVILTQVVGGVRKYYTIANYGQMFYATKGNTVKAVFTGNKSTTAGSSTTTTTSSTSTTASATTTIFMYGVGDADKQLDLDLRNGDANVSIATEIDGYGIFTDSQEDLPFATAAGEDVGTAGAVSLHLKYDEGLSSFSEKNNTSRTAMVTKIQQDLAKQNYTNGDAATTTTGAGSNTGTGSNSGNTGGTGTGSGTGNTGR